MRAYRLFAPALAFLSLPMAAHAADATLQVTAEVQAGCVFRANTYRLDFGSIRADSSDTLTASTAIKYQCTRGTTHKLFVGGPDKGPITHTLLSAASGKPMDYVLNWTSPASAGQGFAGAPDLEIRLTGTLVPAMYQAAEPGSYSTTLRISLLPD